MKKQSKGHRVDRQDVSMVTPFPGQSLVGSKPRGVHTREIAKPMHLNAGAAESRANPVELPRRGGNAKAGGPNSAGGNLR